MTVSAASAFDRHASAYDAARRRLVPCFDDFYGTAVAMLPFAHDAELRILDLGAGTGLLADRISSKFRHAHITLVDAAPAMLDHARQRFSGCERISYEVADYGVQLPSGFFDAVVSALSIHHLEDGGKKKLFETIFGRLVPGGVFVNADQVLAPSQALAAQDREKWRMDCLGAGASTTDLAGAAERMRHDRLAPLLAQLGWLTQAGFMNVDVAYKNGWFAVFGGQRPTSVE